MSVAAKPPAPNRERPRPRRDPSHDLPDPFTGGFFAKMLSGMRAALTGFGFSVRHGEVALWWLGIVVCYMLVWVAVLWTVAAWDDSMVTGILWPPGTSWWESFLWHLCRSVLYLVFWFLAILVAFLIALPLMSPLFVLLAEVVERCFYGEAARHRLDWGKLAKELGAGLVRSAILVLINVLGAVVIWTIGFAIGLLLPPLGTLFAVVVGGGWTSLWFGMLGMTYVLENNQVTFSTQMTTLQQRAPLLLGFGVVAQVFAWLPLTVPMIVISASVLCCRLHRHGHCPLPVRDEWQRSTNEEAADTNA